MVEPAAEPAAEDNPAIPSGYTYLGQFIDHDITFDPASSLQSATTPTRSSTSARPRSTSTRSTAAGRPTSRTCTTGPTGARASFLLGRGQRGDEFDLPRNAPPDIVPDPDADGSRVR